MLNTDKPYIIAIDGTAASGKGTLARRLASHFGYGHLDTGKLYRATAYTILKNSGDCTNVKTALSAVNGLQQKDFSAKELTFNEVGNGASQVSKIPQVREALVKYQRDFPKDKIGAVIDGRDIGTIIFPNADIKFFVDANIKSRAERRQSELAHTGVDYDTILNDLTARDLTDKNREISPLVPANDAYHIDTSTISIEEMVEIALSKF